MDIEELCGTEFHSLVQQNWSAEQLGLELQHLAHKVFPCWVEKISIRCWNVEFTLPCCQSSRVLHGPLRSLVKEPGQQKSEASSRQIITVSHQSFTDQCMHVTYHFASSLDRTAIWICGKRGGGSDSSSSTASKKKGIMQVNIATFEKWQQQYDSDY